MLKKKIEIILNLKKKVENERGKVDRKKYDEVLSREKRELTLVGDKTIKISL